MLVSQNWLYMGPVWNVSVLHFEREEAYISCVYHLYIAFNPRKSYCSHKDTKM